MKRIDQKKVSRQQVYDALSGERIYQNEKWGQERAHTVTEFLVYMRDYVEEALHVVSREPDAVAEEKALHSIRKVAALGVACMEAHGAPEREHACLAPEWCGINRLVGDDKTEADKARSRLYTSTKNPNYGVSNHERNKIYCSTECEAAVVPTRPTNRSVEDQEALVREVS